MAAEKIKAFFEKIAVTYPYQTEIDSEREMMKIAENRFWEMINQNY